VSGLGFLLVALILSVLGSLAIWMRHRPSTSLDNGIDEFQREMRALAPERRGPNGGTNANASANGSATNGNAATNGNGAPSGGAGPNDAGVPGGPPPDERMA
jgi:hypothetical protein